MSIGPLDLIRHPAGSTAVPPRHPAGSPVGGKFAPYRSSAPTRSLTADTPPPSRADQLQAEYRRLWKLTEANHRQNAYFKAEEISQHSDDNRELAVLSRFAKDGVAVNVARNPHTCAAVLHELAVNQRDNASDEARRLAVLHPNCDPETIRIVWAHRGTPDFEGRAADVVSQAPNTPPDVLREAASEGDVRARERLTSIHATTPPAA